MTTRDKLIREFARSRTDEAAKSFSDRILAEHAHELAEKIRHANDHKPECDRTARGCTAHCSYYEEPDEFADLIDPEVDK